MWRLAGTVMHRTGHVGAALLVYTPLGIAVALAGYEPVAVLGAVVAITLSTAPDVDHQLPAVDHRGPTHTVVFALLVGVSLAGVTAALIESASPATDVGIVTFAFAVGTLTIVSHLLADAITPMGIRPFWPVSERRYTVNLARAGNPVANVLLLLLGLAATLVGVGLVFVFG